MIIAPKIKKIRELKGFSQDYMAEKLGVSQPSYSRIEKNDKEINFRKLTLIAEIFGINPMEMINFSDKNIFNNTNQTGGTANVANIENYYAYSKKEKELYETRITHLEKEVEFLRGLVNAKQ